MVRPAFLATLIAGAVCAVPVFAQAPPTPPDHYVLTGARIVTAPGRVIERGTVVLRDGRIAAVGAQVAVPAGAIPLDLTGHTIYAGLIDAAATYGLPAVSGQDAERGAELMPARSAGDVWTAADPNVEAMRNVGFTTLGLTFEGGIFPGRVAAVSTGGAARSPVLRSPIAQQVALGRRRGGYPGTLMGAIAYVKQSFYDVQYDLRARQAFERARSGPRPDYDPEHRALAPAATGEAPVWFLASTERELGRIPALASDIGVRNYVIVGAQEGWRALPALKRAAQPVIVSLEWPSAGEITGRAYELNVAPVSGPNTARAEADSAGLRAARANAAALTRAGIPFALSSHGMDSAATLRDRLRATVEAGLSADDALRALTVTPARLLGLEQAVGTIEPGKLANLVVTRGDLFAPDTRIRHVFVEGVRYDVPEPSETPPEGGRRRSGSREEVSR
jgi:imidazolonepropionase-like amidohydrolase